MLMALQQGVVQNADGVRSRALSRMLMAFAARRLAVMLMRRRKKVGRNADGVAARRLAVMLMVTPQESWLYADGVAAGG